MGIYSHTGMLDAALNALMSATDLFYLLTGDPAEYGDIGSGECQIMSVWSTPVGAFSDIFNGSLSEPPDIEAEGYVDSGYDNSGRAIQITKVVINSVDIDGFPSMLVLCNMTDILYKTTISGVQLTEGEPIVIDSWNILIHEPTASESVTVT